MIANSPPVFLEMSSLPTLTRQDTFPFLRAVKQLRYDSVQSQWEEAAYAILLQQQVAQEVGEVSDDEHYEILEN